MTDEARILSQCPLVAFGRSTSCLPALNSDQKRARESKSHYPNKFHSREIEKEGQLLSFILCCGERTSEVRMESASRISILKLKGGREGKVREGRGRKQREAIGVGE